MKWNNHIPWPRVQSLPLRITGLCLKGNTGQVTSIIKIQRINQTSERKVQDWIQKCNGRALYRVQAEPVGDSFFVAPRSSVRNVSLVEPVEVRVFNTVTTVAAHIVESIHATPSVPLGARGTSSKRGGRMESGKGKPPHLMAWSKPPPLFSLAAIPRHQRGGSITVLCRVVLPPVQQLSPTLPVTGRQPLRTGRTTWSFFIVVDPASTRVSLFNRLYSILCKLVRWHRLGFATKLARMQWVRQQYDFYGENILGELRWKFNVDGIDGWDVYVESKVTLNLDFNDRPSSSFETTASDSLCSVRGYSRTQCYQRNRMKRG